MFIHLIYFGEEVEGTILTLSHEQPNLDYEYKEVCFTVLSIFIISKKVLH